MQDRVFYSSCAGFVLGILLRSFVLLNIHGVLMLAVFAVFLIFIFSALYSNKIILLTGVFVLAFGLGVLRFHLSDDPPPEIFESKLGQSHSFSGLLVDEPDIREKNQKLTIEVEEDGEQTKILVTIGFDQKFRYGDELGFAGKLKKPENFITDQGKEFDYINYLRKDDIEYVISYPVIEVLSHGHGNKIKSILFHVKEKFLENINFTIREPESLLMSGLILGEKSAFSQNLRQSFVDTGTIHIVALSGYNVTIVAEWFMKIFSNLPRHFGIGMGIFSVIIFVLMSGGSSTALRAGVMAVLSLVARATGRNYDVGRALILAGIIMMLFNPFVLVYDVSFQLSFIATIAVIFFAPKIQKYFLWITEKGKLRDIVSVTCACYIFVLPFILYKMGNLSLVALPANILILPVIPLTMALGFLTGFFGIIWYGLAVPFGYLSYALLHYELSVIDFFARFSYASLSIPNFPMWLTIAIYIFFTYYIFGKNIRKLFRGGNGHTY